MKLSCFPRRIYTQGKTPVQKLQRLSSQFKCFDQYVGPGYTVPTDEMIAAVKLAAGTEGILLDPVYTGKAMAGLIDMVKNGFLKKRLIFYYCILAELRFFKGVLFISAKLDTFLFRNWYAMLRHLVTQDDRITYIEL